jgi:hypothetical protein
VLSVDKVRLLAAELRIELLYLPADASNLDLSERLRKFGKKEVLSCRPPEDFARFEAALVECRNRNPVAGKPRSAIASLLTSISRPATILNS